MENEFWIIYYFGAVNIVAITVYILIKRPKVSWGLLILIYILAAIGSFLITAAITVLFFMISISLWSFWDKPVFKQKE